METLPVEMVERIVQQLTPQDLARCSAVCREWREIFNQDWMWQPHCDPELEEPLRTIPCVATPAFVAPEAENSTLSPICCWKLAFMRENNLWKNWRTKETMDNSETVIKFDDKDIVNVDFLTDTLVLVVRYPHHIEVFDVSVVPTALVAKTDISINIGEYYSYSYTLYHVIGPNMLLVETENSVQFYNVDIFNKTIKMKHSISLWCRYKSPFSVVQDKFVINEALKLRIFDLNTFKLLKEELCPVKDTQNEIGHFHRIKSSPTSDLLACLIVIYDTSNGYGKRYCKYYIYSLKQLAFLPGPVAEYEDSHYRFAFLGHWIATTDNKTLKVYNFQTRDVLLSHEYSKSLFRFHHQEDGIETFNKCFVFLEGDVSEFELGESCLKVYFPSHRSLTTICEMSNTDAFRIINNKFIELIYDENSVSVWKLSGQAVEKCDFTVRFGHKTNRSFTKVLNKNYLEEESSFTINYLW